jgi:hypothetical protein
MKQRNSRQAHWQSCPEEVKFPFYCQMIEIRMMMIDPDARKCVSRHQYIVSPAAQISPSFVYLLYTTFPSAQTLATSFIYAFQQFRSWSWAKVFPN